jgi:hypothetical protein
MGADQLPPMRPKQLVKRLLQSVLAGLFVPSVKKNWKKGESHSEF